MATSLFKFDQRNEFMTKRAELRFKVRSVLGGNGKVVMKSHGSIIIQEVGYLDGDRHEGIPPMTPFGRFAEVPRDGHGVCSDEDRDGSKSPVVSPSHGVSDQISTSPGPSQSSHQDSQSSGVSSHVERDGWQVQGVDNKMYSPHMFPSGGGSSESTAMFSFSTPPSKSTSKATPQAPTKKRRPATPLMSNDVIESLTAKRLRFESPGANSK